MTFVNPTRVKLEYPTDPHTDLIIPAGRFVLTDGAAALAKVASWPAWVFDAAVFESVSVTFGRAEIPASWSSYTVELLWANTAASVGNVTWQLGYSTPQGEGDAITVNGSVESLGIASGAGVLVRTTFPQVVHAVPSETDPIVMMRILRNAAVAGDTLANDAALIALRLVKVT